MHPSLTMGPVVNGSREALPSCAEETPAVESAQLTSEPARHVADSLAEKVSTSPRACDRPDADGNSFSPTASRAVHQSPDGIHPAQPEEDGAARSAATQQIGALPHAVAWEVPAGGPSLAVSHALQPAHQTPGGRDRSAGIGHGPQRQVSASQPAAEGVHAPPVQRDAATSPVRDVLPPYDFTDRSGMLCFSMTLADAVLRLVVGIIKMLYGLQLAVAIVLDRDSHVLLNDRAIRGHDAARSLRRSDGAWLPRWSASTGRCSATTQRSGPRPALHRRPSCAVSGPRPEAATTMVQLHRQTGMPKGQLQTRRLIKMQMRLSASTERPATSCPLMAVACAAAWLTRRCGRLLCSATRCGTRASRHSDVQ